MYQTFEEHSLQLCTRTHELWRVRIMHADLTSSLFIKASYTGVLIAWKIIQIQWIKGRRGVGTSPFWMSLHRLSEGETRRWKKTPLSPILRQGTRSGSPSRLMETARIQRGKWLDEPRMILRLVICNGTSRTSSKLRVHIFRPIPSQTLPRTWWKQQNAMLCLRRERISYWSTIGSSITRPLSRSCFWYTPDGK